MITNLKDNKLNQIKTLTHKLSTLRDSKHNQIKISTLKLSKVLRDLNNIK
jgi:hypothetical protein